MAITPKKNATNTCKSACVASILRLRTLYVSEKSKDVTWDKTGTVYWSTVEINVGIICSSLTTLHAMASRLFPRLFKYRGRVQTTTSAGNEIHGNVDLETTKNPAFESEGSGSGHGRDVD
jgi:hypothetical protein